MRVVVALGGNALLKRGEPLEIEVQRRNVGAAVRSIAEVARAHDLVVTHGNGPQVGLLAAQAEAESRESGSRPFPLDVLGAESEGMIGYLLEQGIQNQLPGKEVATLLTQVIVDEEDPAFAAPSKPIGRVYREDEARRWAKEHGWTIARDGEYMRRVVPSPEPRSIVEIKIIKLLVAAGVIVICGGGGGIPVVIDQAGAMRGVEAVIDKDLAAELLSELLPADILLLLTDVEGVLSEWGTAGSRLIARATPDTLRSGGFASGSMGPKVEAAARFVEATGKRAAIGSIDQAAAVLSGDAGTQVFP